MGWIIEGFDEARPTRKHAKHTHPDTVLLSASFEGMLMAAPRQTDNHRGVDHTGVCWAHSPDQPMRKTAPRPKRCWCLLHPGGCQGSELTMPQSFFQKNGFLFPSASSLFFFYECLLLPAVDFSPVLRSVCLEIVQWLSSFSPLKRPALWPHHSTHLFTMQIDSELAAG